MKRIISCIVIIVIISCSVLCACSKTEKKDVYEIPEISSIQAICDLSTQECYYHTVATVEKPQNADNEFFDFLKKGRKAWIEYTAIAQIGIDMTKVKLEVKNNSVRINIPEAEIISIVVDPNSYNKDSFYESKDDWLIKNIITAEYETKAIKAGQEKTKSAITDNKTLMKNARIRAQKLIKNYIDEIGRATGISYKIIWLYEDGTSSTTIPDLEMEAIK